MLPQTCGTLNFECEIRGGCFAFAMMRLGHLDAGRIIIEFPSGTRTWDNFGQRISIDFKFFKC